MRLVDPQMEQVLVRCDADPGLELAGELTHRQAGHGRHIRQRHRLPEPRPEEILDAGELAIGQPGRSAASVDVRRPYTDRVLSG